MPPRRIRRRKIKRLASELSKNRPVPVNVEEIAKELGLEIKRGDLGEVSAFLVREDRKIGVNSEQSKTRQQFGIAHEIGHYLLHTDDVHIDKIFAQRIKNECFILVTTTNRLQYQR